MNVIYKPKGRALEYAPLACNLYLGCTHGCKYCYAPGCMRKTLDVWHSEATARKDIIELFEKDAIWLSQNRPDNEARRVLFCFLSDPYQPLESKLHVTRNCLEIAKKHGIKIDVLTKGSFVRVSRDLDLMASAGCRLGVTLSFVTDRKRKEWEPSASSVSERLKLLKLAHSKGIYTWVSVEPVIDPVEALKVIERAHEYVDYWKIGKLNYNKQVSDGIDWHKFYCDLKKLLRRLKAKAYIKNSLRVYAKKNDNGCIKRGRN